MGERCRRAEEAFAVVAAELASHGGGDREQPCSEMPEKRRRRRDAESELADSENRSKSRRRVTIETATMTTESVSCCSSVYVVADRSTSSNPTEEEMESAQRETMTFSGATNSEEHDMESITFRETSSLRKEKSMPTMPSGVEIDEFLTAAENDLHKSFSEKYNFDVAKGVPLKGRYEWVPVKP